MPQQPRFTRDEILQAALELTRIQGSGALTARSLAQALGCSVRPIFGLFKNMEEVQTCVLSAARQLYQQRIDEAMTKRDDPPYKASGLAYIRFAREEPHLFRLLFMRDRHGQPDPKDESDIQPILSLLQQKLKLSPEDALRFHLENWAFVHGLATMITTGYLNLEQDQCRELLSDIYQGLVHRYTGGK